MLLNTLKCHFSRVHIHVFELKSQLKHGMQNVVVTFILRASSEIKSTAEDNFHLNGI